MRIDVVTLFPELFPGPLATGLVGRALESGSAEVGFVNPRDFARDRHKSVDDAPYGGGAGMVMKPDLLAEAIAAARRRGGGPVVLMSPQGRPLIQADLARWAAGGHLVLVAGRYEGFDERTGRAVDEEISLGDFVLTGGEYAALTIIDGVVRLLPGTLGNAASPEGDSFSEGLLEHPHYTRPVELEGARVPDVLLSGNHAEVAKWRREASLARTRWRRPDLLAARGFSVEDRLALVNAPSAAPPLGLAVALSDLDGAPRIAADLAALAAAYGLEALALVAPRPEDVERLQAAVEAAPVRRVPRLLAPREEKRLRKKRGAPWPAVTVSAAERISVLARVEAIGEIPGFEQALRLGAHRGVPPGPVIAPAAARVRAPGGLLLCLGPGFVGEAAPSAFLPELRVGAEANDLPLLAAAAVLLDRLRGEA